jgi:hypothetical protein
VNYELLAEEMPEPLREIMEEVATMEKKRAELLTTAGWKPRGHLWQHPKTGEVLAEAGGGS